MVEPTVQSKLTAEAIGTFVLVFLGCGSAVYAGSLRAFDLGTVGLTFGLAVMVMVYAFGRISGGHFNPAVSVGAAIGGRIPWREAGLYAAAQVAGAILGALLLFLLMHGFEGFAPEGNMGQNSFGDAGSGYAWWAAFVLELVLTAVFVLVILAVTDERNEHPALAPLAIGFTLAAIHFVAIPATGTSVNPARSIGPALFAGPDAIVQLWLFILAPVIGAVLAGLAYPLAFGRVGDPVPGSGIVLPRPRTAAQAQGRGQGRGLSQGQGYAAPDQYQQQWNQEVGARSAGQSSAQPIIQDGWQWDPVGQQWHPAGQTPEQWRAYQAEESARAQEAQPGHDQQGEDPGPAGTHLRPQ